MSARLGGQHIFKPRGLVHLAHPDDCAYNLCGKICTRDDPQVENGGEVSCLSCMVHDENGTKAELE